MAKQHPTPKTDPQMVAMGFVHENVVCKTWGYAWSTWERDHRLKVPGTTKPSGRWYHEKDLVQHFRDNATTGSEGSR
ncbi:hypothetical protein RISK_004932 [Rhodopirellula islandica]|uniref:HTH merR-type domain-containing protein n=1 Tax=Rhodopirellula islandica TaxID=595434 RepID=A0A0J1B8B6_RHOIS|nr:hypothetical protein RISK_004932 [Rhodopirellula islandica]